MKKIAIYARVSTNTGKQDTTRQVDELIQVAKQHGYHSNQIDVFQENISGYKSASERPKLQELINIINADTNYYSCIYLHELSRLGRKPKHTSEILNQWIEQQIPVYIKNVDLFTIVNGKRNNTAMIVLQVFQELADQEAQIFKERTESGRLQKIKNGGIMAGANIPFGYKSQDKKLVIDDEEAKIVNQIYDWYVAGDSDKNITKMLNDANVLTRKNKQTDKLYKGGIYFKNNSQIKWSQSTIKGILTNTIYIGKRRFKNEIVQSPVIIDEKKFLLAQEQRKIKKPKKSIDKHLFLMKGLVKCQCGYNFFGHYGKSGGENCYKCSSRINKYAKPCGHLGINRKLFESTIFHLLLNSKKVIKMLTDSSKIKSELQTKIKVAKLAIEDNQGKLATATKQQSKLVDLILANDDSEVYVQKNKELSNTIKALKSKHQTLTTELAKLELSLTKISDSSATIDSLRNADRYQLQAYFRQIIHQAIVHTANKEMAVISLYLGNGGVVIPEPFVLVLDLKSLKVAEKYQKYRYYVLPRLGKDDTPIGVVGVDFQTKIKNWITIPDSDLVNM